MSTTMNRRSFVKMGGAAAVAAVAAPAAAHADEAQEETPAYGSWKIAPEPVSEDSIVDTVEAEIVIVGAGLAGTAAARAAAEAGANVVVLEQQALDTFAVFASECGTVNAQFSMDRGIPEYDTLAFRQDWMRRTFGRCNPTLIKEYAEKSGAMFDWFVEPLDDAFRDSINTFRYNATAGTVNGWTNILGTNIFRGGDEEHDYSLTAAIRINQQVAEGLGARFDFGTKGYYLEKDADGRVNAVIATNADGAYVRYTASKAVLLAAGDFSNNSQMVLELLPEVVACAGGVAPMGFAWDGSGIQMGVWAGGIIDPGPAAPMGGPSAAESGALQATPFLKLNRDGKRFCAESFMGIYGYRFQCGRQPRQGIITAVFDSHWEENVRNAPCDHGSVDLDNPIIADRLIAEMAALECGPEGGQVTSALTSTSTSTVTMFKADTLDELADYLGYTGEAKVNFLASIERYNELCDKGVDEDFAGDPAAMYPVKDAPFYGAVTESRRNSMLCTVTGLMIDGEQRVLDADFEVIPGLYATGNNSGCRYAVSYSTPVAGCSCGIALTLGRCVGEELAAL